MDSIHTVSRSKASQFAGFYISFCSQTKYSCFSTGPLSVSSGKTFAKGFGGLLLVRVTTSITSAGLTAIVEEILRQQ